MLRRESDDVRELLKTETLQPELFETHTEHSVQKPRKRTGLLLPATSYTVPDEAAFREFLSELDEKSRRALEIIGGGSGSTAQQALRELALENGTMPALLVDMINTAFEGRFGDLVIENSSDGPSIPQEYQSILKRLWE